MIDCITNKDNNISFRGVVSHKKTPIFANEQTPESEKMLLKAIFKN
jgi:hypothetical protein